MVPFREYESDMPVEYGKSCHCLSDDSDLQPTCTRLQVLPLNWLACLRSNEPSAVEFLRSCEYGPLSLASRGPCTCTYAIEQHKFNVRVLQFSERVGTRLDAKGWQTRVGVSMFCGIISRIAFIKASSHMRDPGLFYIESATCNFICKFFVARGPIRCQSRCLVGRFFKPRIDS